jgi:DNA-binding transcriptional MerR regulator/methylmalonyl-CoA mutase cobalamin-binding subunit
MASDREHTMKVVARRTGLSPHVIRMWEKRYGAVTPARTDTRRRLYTEADIARLVLLRQATLLGHSIGRIATLPTDQLRTLVNEDAATTPPAPPPSPVQARADTLAAESFLDVCLDAVRRLDAVTLEMTLLRARVMLSHTAFLDVLIVPLMQAIGDLWYQGVLRIMHEHLTSAVVRTLLGSLTVTPGLPDTAPHLIVTTPAGQLHEIGALCVASTASVDGWRVTYLGPNLPAEDIAAAVQQDHARAICLSIIYPPDDPYLLQELAKLRRYLTSDVTIFVGGRGNSGYQESLDHLGALRPHDLQEFRRHLEALRARQSPS